MKKRFVILLSLFVMALCATTLVACNKYNDEKLIVNGYTMYYGSSVDFSKFNVAYYKDGETHPLTLKGQYDPYGHYDNPNGDYVWEQVGSSSGEEGLPLDVDKPKHGLYSLKFSYRNLSKIVTLVVNRADYPETVALTVDESVKYLGNKPNIELSNLPEDANITYQFMKAIESGDGIAYTKWGNPIEKSYYENELSSTSWFLAKNFEVGNYKVYAEIDIEGNNYNKIVTEQVDFEITKASLKGKYYIATSTAHVQYAGDTLDKYYIPNEFVLQPMVQNLPYSLVINQNYTLSWNNPDQAVVVDEIMSQNVELLFTSKNFTLHDNTDLQEVGLIVKPANFPYDEVALEVDGQVLQYADSVDYQASYELELKVRSSHSGSWIDIPDEFDVVLTDFDGNNVDVTYFVSADDATRGYFRIGYSIVHADGKYRSADGYVDVRFADTAYAGQDNLEAAIAYATAHYDEQNPITVVLVEDVVLENDLVIDGQVDIDFGAHTITGANIDGGALRVLEGATVNLFGTTGGIVGGSGADCKAVRAYGTVNIYGGHYSVGPDADGNGNSCIYAAANTASVNIYGGYFETAAAWHDWYYVLNQLNSATESQICVYGGSFVNYNPENGDDALHGNFVAERYHAEQNENVYSVVEDTEEE